MFPAGMLAVCGKNIELFFYNNRSPAVVNSCLQKDKSLLYFSYTSNIKKEGYMAKEKHVSIRISKNAALVLEELKELSGLEQERILDEAVKLYYQRTVHHWRVMKENEGSKSNEYGPSV